MNSEPEVLLQVSNINVSYDKLGVLWDVSLKVRRGEIVAIVGANGAGKSTLLKTISGVLHPTDGSIVFDGQTITNSDPYKIVGLGISQIPEGRQLFPDDWCLKSNQHCRTVLTVSSESQPTERLACISRFRADTGMISNTQIPMAMIMVASLEVRSINIPALFPMRVLSIPRK